MARDGSGTYNRPVSDYVFNTVISETDVNTEMDQIATALTDSLAKDGQTNPTANLPMATFRHTGVGNASARTDYAAAGQVQDGAFTWVDGGGTADAITATYSPAITALVDGMLFGVRATAANATTTPTFAPNGLAAHTITKKGGSALAAGDIVGDGHDLLLRYDLTNTRWELLNPGASGLTGSGTSGALTQFTGSSTIGDVTLTDAAPALADKLVALDANNSDDLIQVTPQEIFDLINSLTAETAPATGDKVALYDADGAQADAITLANLLKVVNSLTEDSSPDTASDYLLSYDADAAAVKKVLMSNAAAGGFAPVVKGSDEIVASSTTLQNDDALVFAVDANSTYVFLMYLNHVDDSGGIADIKFDFSLPAGASGHYSGRASTRDDMGTPVSDGSSTSPGRGPLLHGYITTAGTSGNAQFQWAQNVSDVSNVTVKAGSWLAWKKV